MLVSFLLLAGCSKYIEHVGRKFVVIGNFNSPALARMEPMDNRILHKVGGLGGTTVYGESLTFIFMGFS